MKRFLLIVACTALWLGAMAVDPPCQAALITVEPDNYAVNTPLPDFPGLKLRNSSYRPGHVEFDRIWRRIYAKSPDVFPYCGPSTGSLVMGYDSSHYFNGYEYGVRAWFVDSTNNFQPTTYVGFDICWASTVSWSEGAQVVAYGEDAQGQEIVLFNRVYKPSGAFTTVNLFLPGITWLKVVCWDDPNYFRQMAFSVDDFRFSDFSGSAYVIPHGTSITAPAGMSLGSDDSLSGDGQVVGDLTNGGRVSPGLSPGTLAVTGDYTQLSSGILEIEIFGAESGQFDRLLVSGDAALGGTLEIRLDGYLPVLGEAFSIVSCRSLIGVFDHIRVDRAPAGFFFEIDYGDHEFTIIAVPEPASLKLLLLAALMLICRRRSTR